MRTVVANDLAQLADAIANRFEVAADLAIAAGGSRVLSRAVEWSRVVLLQAHYRPVPLYDDEGRGISWRMLAAHVVPADDETVAEGHRSGAPDRRGGAHDRRGRPHRGDLPREQLQGARELWIIAFSGAACGPVVREALEDPHSMLPIAELTRNAGDVIWFLDADAAALLGSAVNDTQAPPG